MPATNFKHDQPTRKQLKAARARLQAKIEREENAKVALRSEGQCEIYEEDAEGLLWPCLNEAEQIHHMIGKWRQRGRGKSALSEHKQHACTGHHTLITGRLGLRNYKLVRVGGPVPRWTDHYRRAV